MSRHAAVDDQCLADGDLRVVGAGERVGVAQAADHPVVEVGRINDVVDRGIRVARDSSSSRKPFHTIVLARDSHRAAIPACNGV